MFGGLCDNKHIMSNAWNPTRGANSTLSCDIYVIQLHIFTRAQLHENLEDPQPCLTAFFKAFSRGSYPFVKAFLGVPILFKRLLPTLFKAFLKARLKAFLGDSYHF